MFGIGGGEFITLLIIALILVGPDRLPKLSVDAARLVKKIRLLANNATTELRENLGPGFEDLQVTDLHPRKLISKHLNEALAQTDEEIKEIGKSAKIDPDIL